MKIQRYKRKKFGEILDETFLLSKNHFRDFFLITLIVIGPVYFVEAIVHMTTGVEFFRDVSRGSNRLEDIFATFDQNMDFVNPAMGSTTVLLALALAALFPVAQAAFLYAIDTLNQGKEFSVKTVIKKGFSKLWRLFFSSLLFGILIVGFFIIIIVILTVILVSTFLMEPVGSILMSVGLFFLFFLISALIFTRWGFYIGSIAIEDKAPGLINSWRLTRKQTWRTFGLLLILYFIVGIVSFVMESIFSLFLGYSVLLTIIVNIVTLATLVISMVGYAVIYFDLGTKHQADDLKKMIDNYDEN